MKILVYGVYGAGKSVLAAQIAERLRLTWHPVDELTWEPGWKEVPEAQQRKRIAMVCGQDDWVLDGAYASWLDLPLSAADLLVCLDYPRWFSLARLVRRTARLVVTRERICNGNYETLGSVFSADSIIVWHFGSFALKRRRMREWAASSPGPPVILLRSQRETSQWLETLALRT